MKNLKKTRLNQEKLLRGILYPVDDLMRGLNDDASDGESDGEHHLFSQGQSMDQERCWRKRQSDEMGEAVKVGYLKGLMPIKFLWFD